MALSRRGLAAVTLAVLLTASGCAGQGKGTGTSGDASAAPSGVEQISFWNGFTGPDRATVEKLVADFNSTHPNIKVDMQISPWDVFFQKLLPAISSGKGPDLMAMDSAQLPQYASRGVLRPLDTYYSSVADTKNLIPAAVDAAKWSGKSYGVPMNFTTLALYWNKDMFKAAGLDPNKPPTNWDEFASMALKLTKDPTGSGKPEQYGLAIADHSTIAMWPILLWGNGGGVVSQDGKTSMLGDPKTIEAADKWAKLVRDQHISPVGLAGADADKLFQSKKAAMEIVGPWMTTGFTQAGIDYGLAAVPAGPAGPVTLGTSVAFAVNAKTTDAKAAAAQEFVSFWNSKDSQVTWALGSGFPPNRTDIPPSALAQNPAITAFGEHADTAKFYLKNVKDFTKVNDTIFEPALQKLLNGKGSAADLFGQASKDIQAVLDQSK